MSIYIIRRFVPMIIIFLILGVILLKKGLKLKTNICQSCGNKINQEKVCPKCSSIINNKEQAKKILVICGGISCIIAIYNLLRLIEIIIFNLFH